MPQAKRLHYTYVGPYMTHEMLCRDISETPAFWLPGRKPQCTMDPAQVTCVACKRKMSKLGRAST
ncbi:MAG TPA: hypothetical protein VI542_30960, partial [Candidatus Tectomicrobia bacterium]